jgi:hypothetical protein
VLPDIRLCHIYEPSGVIGNSTFTVSPIGGPSANLTMCFIEAYLALSASSAPGWGSEIMGCLAVGGSALAGSSNAGSLGFPNCLALWSTLSTGYFINSLMNAYVDGDCTLNGSTELFAGVNLIAGLITGDLHLAEGRARIIDPLYGPGSCDVSSGAMTLDTQWGTFTNFVKLGSMTLNDSSTGTKVTTAGGIETFTEGVPIDSASIDAFGALMNTRTGARYAVTVN